jgi:chaperone LolA
MYNTAMKLKTFFMTTLILLGSISNAHGQESVAKLQSALDDLQTMSAHFDQVLSSTKFGEEKASGHLHVKRPNQMRWLYQKPEPKLLLADGKSFHTFDASDPEPRSVLQRNLMEQETSFFFLWKKVNLLDHFSVQAVPVSDAKQMQYKLVPKKKHADVQYIQLKVSFSPFQIHQIETLDPLGQTNQLTLSDVQLNEKIKEDVFDFEQARKKIERKKS